MQMQNRSDIGFAVFILADGFFMIGVHKRYQDAPGKTGRGFDNVGNITAVVRGIQVGNFLAAIFAVTA